MASVEKALLMLRNLPRVALNNVRDYPEVIRERKKQHAAPRGKEAKFKLGADHKGAAQRMSRPRLGFGKSTPSYLRIPKEYYYQGHHLLRQYIPLSLLQLQRMIDLGRVDPNEPIDLTTICNTNIIMINPQHRQFGVQLVDDGCDSFKAQVNLEVQWVQSELAIAAIERNGGTITTKFYDIGCVQAMCDPMKFFKKGKPIPKNSTPPLNAIEFYTSAVNRGYLANPDEIRVERLKLAQKYGYVLPDLVNHPLKDMLAKRKDPRQIWYGLEPGWMVNLADQVVIKPTDKELIDYYKE